MDNKIVFNEAMIKRYDCTGPRYTSYPTAVQFRSSYSAADYRDWVNTSNDDPIPAPLSLYLHIPFCNTVCYYCGCSKIVTKDKAKARDYIELLKQEIELQGALFDTDRRVTQMHWGGGTPTFLEDEAITDILGALQQHFRLEMNDSGEFSIEVDPRTVDVQRIANLRAMGFNRISFGVQDFNPEVQEAVNRVQDTQQIMDNMQAARANSFHSINIDLMYGLPKQSLQSFAQTIDTTIEADPDRIAVYSYAHMPDMFKPQRRIDEDELPAAEDKLAILQMTIEKLQQAGYVYIGMDHFAKHNDDLVKAQQNGTLHRNFQGYSTHADCDIVAMGITAISSIGDNYSQNFKTMDDYAAALDICEIPVYRGIELEADDVLRREIINQLMCHFKLDIKQFESRWGIDFRSYFESALTELHKMSNDGLLKISDERIEITPVGRLLARPICMKFDRYLQEKEQQQRFSRVI